MDHMDVINEYSKKSEDFAISLDMVTLEKAVMDMDWEILIKDLFTKINNVDLQSRQLECISDHRIPIEVRLFIVSTHFMMFSDLFSKIATLFSECAKEMKNF